MDFRTNITRQALAILGACLGLLLLAGPASARPDESSDAFTRYVANHRAHEEQVYHATRTGIPDSVAAALKQQASAAAEPLVIPYLSHGIGIESGDPAPTLREQPDGFQPQLHGVESTRVAADGFDWETTGYVGGAILAAMLLALMSTIALRDRRGLRSA